MGQAYHEAYKRSLMNLKARDIQSVAARLCNALREFPKNTRSRTKTVTTGATTETVNIAGAVYDSIWSENIGSTIACVKGVTRTNAYKALDFMFSLADYMNLYSVYYTTDQTTTKPVFTDYLSTLRTKYTTCEIASVAAGASKTLSNFTYNQLGFTLNPKLIDVVRPAEGAEPTDVYEFCRMIARIDIIAMMKMLNSKFDSAEWSAISGDKLAKANELKTMWTNAKKIIALMIEMISDMAGLAEGVVGNEYSDDGCPTNTTPLTDDSFVAVTTDVSAAKSAFIQVVTDTSCQMVIKKTNKRFQLYVKTKYPFYMKKIWNSSSNEIARFTLVRTTGSGASGVAEYLSDVFDHGSISDVLTIFYGRVVDSTATNTASTSIEYSLKVIGDMT